MRQGVGHTLKVQAANFGDVLTHATGSLVGFETGVRILVLELEALQLGGAPGRE